MIPEIHFQVGGIISSIIAGKNLQKIDQSIYCIDLYSKPNEFLLTLIAWDSWKCGGSFSLHPLTKNRCERPFFDFKKVHSESENLKKFDTSIQIFSWKNRH